MPNRFFLGSIGVDVLFKDIQNLHLSVYPPHGAVRISAPHRMKLDTIRVYALSKLSWIKNQQKKFKEQERETIREYITRESHYLWGKRYLFKLIPCNDSHRISIKNSTLQLHASEDISLLRKKEVMDEWYRAELRTEANVLIAKWEKILGVKNNHLYIQKMKTKWGSCNHKRHTVRLNTELAKKPLECLEYIVVHELVHNIEPSHNCRFVELMDKYMPKWQFYRRLLNRLPISHIDWGY